MDPSARRALVRKLAAAGVGAVDAGRLLQRALASVFSEASALAPRSSIIAVGKAAAPMVEAFLEWSDGRAADGVVSAPTIPHALPPVLSAFAAGHPHPTLESVAAGRAALDCAARTENDLVVLLSGGASALLAAPAVPVTLEDKITLTRFLLGRGVAIDGLNAVRKHLSAVKGGQLATATRARVHTFALSDVTRPVDDDPPTIGSGPTVADPTTFAAAWQVLESAGPEWQRLAPRAAARLRGGCDGVVAETPKPGDPRLQRARFTVIGNRGTAADGAAAAARAAQLRVVVREAAVSGEARDAAPLLLDEALAAAAEGGRPLCFVATGETTVTVRGRGRGGRNQEFALAVALELERRGGAAGLVTVASVGTDGVDGPTDAAGAIADETTVARGAVRADDAARRLAANDSYPFFSGLDDLVMTGPTGTNVGDLVVVLVA